MSSVIGREIIISGDVYRTVMPNATKRTSQRRLIACDTASSLAFAKNVSLAMSNARQLEMLTDAITRLQVVSIHTVSITTSVNNNSYNDAGLTDVDRDDLYTSTTTSSYNVNNAEGVFREIIKITTLDLNISPIAPSGLYVNLVWEVGNERVIFASTGQGNGEYSIYTGGMSFSPQDPPILHYILQQIFGTLDAHSVASKINNGVLTMDLHVWLTQAQY